MLLQYTKHMQVFTEPLVMLVAMTVLDSAHLKQVKRAINRS